MFPVTVRDLRPRRGAHLDARSEGTLTATFAAPGNDPAVDDPLTTLVGMTVLSHTVVLSLAGPPVRYRGV